MNEAKDRRNNEAAKVRAPLVLAVQRMPMKAREALHILQSTLRTALLAEEAHKTC
jgi:hypothetical protein